MRGRRYIFWLGALWLLVWPLLSGCGSEERTGAGGEVHVVTSTSILEALVREVGGESVSVEALIKPGVDPHTFETSPGDARTLADADLVLLIGLQLDDFLIDDIEGANDDVPVVAVSEGVALLPFGEHDENDNEDHEDDEEHAAGDGHDHEHGEFDPHVWQDPLRVQKIVDNIAAALADVDPERVDEYNGNAAAYRETLAEADREIAALIDRIPAESRKIVTNHDAFGYFADRYGLEVVGTVIPGSSADADPSAGEYAELAELIEREHVPAIFGEALIDPKVAEQLAADTGVKIITGLYSDQVGEPGSGAETVHEMLLANARKISEALR